MLRSSGSTISHSTVGSCCASNPTLGVGLNSLHGCRLTMEYLSLPYSACHCMVILLHNQATPKIIGQAGASPPSVSYGLNFYMFAHIPYVFLTCIYLLSNFSLFTQLQDVHRLQLGYTVWQSDLLPMLRTIKLRITCDYALHFHLSAATSFCYSQFSSAIPFSLCFAGVTSCYAWPPDGLTVHFCTVNYAYTTYCLGPFIV